MGTVPAAGCPFLVAQSETMQAILRTARRVASTGAKVLITGESGVGKDLIARFIHAQSQRATRPFVAINCAGITETLLESELFGHVRGSFTGAHRDKIGKLQLANHGTVFLDEVGEMTPRMQALLLRFLENGEIQPVGADAAVQRVDVRVIAATNRNLRQCVEAGTFREDLMYRLDVIHLHVPPLRERADDLRLLIQHLAREREPALTITEPAMDLLLRYGWPGNVRELQNVVEQISVVAMDRPATVADLPLSIRGTINPLQPGDGAGPRSEMLNELFEGIVAGRRNFWGDVYPQFVQRDMTRNDVRALIRRGLQETDGNYRALLRLFHMPRDDYKRLMNFLSAHECSVDFREFRSSLRMASMRRRPLGGRARLSA